MPSVNKSFSLQTLLVVVLLFGMAISHFLQGRRMKVFEKQAELVQAEHRSEQQQLEEKIALMLKQTNESQRVTAHQLRTVEFPWVASDDGKVLARLVPEHDELRAGQSIRLTMEVKNGTDQPLTLNQANLPSYDVKLTCNGNDVDYVGPVPCPAPPFPILLLPHTVSRASTELDVTNFPGLAQKGTIEASWTYHSSAPGPQGWQGSIRLTATWINQ